MSKISAIVVPSKGRPEVPILDVFQPSFKWPMKVCVPEAQYGLYKQYHGGTHICAYSYDEAVPWGKPLVINEFLARVAETAPGSWVLSMDDNTIRISGCRTLAEVVDLCESVIEESEAADPNRAVISGTRSTERALADSMTEDNTMWLSGKVLLVRAGSFYLPPAVESDMQMGFSALHAGWRPWQSSRIVMDWASPLDPDHPGGIGTYLDRAKWIIGEHAWAQAFYGKLVYRVVGAGVHPTYPECPSRLNFPYSEDRLRQARERLPAWTPFDFADAFVRPAFARRV